jgi:hypothetical protein
MVNLDSQMLIEVILIYNLKQIIMVCIVGQRILGSSSALRGSSLPVAHPPAVRPASRAVLRRREATVSVKAVAAEPMMKRPDDTGRYGRFGGKYVPETLISALAELEQAYAEAMNDPAFIVST